jgi:hypothetical protein
VEVEDTLLFGLEARTSAIAGLDGRGARRFGLTSQGSSLLTRQRERRVALAVPVLREGDGRHKGQSQGERDGLLPHVLLPIFTVTRAAVVTVVSRRPLGFSSVCSAYLQ